MALWWQPIRRPNGRLVWYVVSAKDWFLAREALTALTSTEADPCTATGWRKTEHGQLRVLNEIVQHVLEKQRARQRYRVTEFKVSVPRTDTPGEGAPSPEPRTTP